jgi:hypothetical protein
MFRVGAAVAICVAISGCNSGYPAADSRDLLVSMESNLKKVNENPTRIEMTRPIKLEDFPILSMVCADTFKTPNYQYKGQTMRSKLQKFAYKMPNTDGNIYRHELAVCFDFYPVAEGQKQEAVYIKYLGTLDSKASTMITAIKEIEGGVDGLLQDSGFHIPGLTVPSSAWSTLDSDHYTKERTDVQYLKMNPIEMKAVSAYDAEKYKDLLAFEMVRVNVTNVGGVIQIADVDFAIVQNAMD